MKIQVEMCQEKIWQIIFSKKKATYDQIDFIFYTCVKFHDCKNG